MDTQDIDTFITKIRASVDSLADKLSEELEEVREFLRDGKFDEALAKVDAMITSVEELDNDE
jgi:hypothetical protein